MKADDLLRFEQLMTLLLARGPAGSTRIETVFREAVKLAGLEDQVWLESDIPRRCAEACTEA